MKDSTFSGLLTSPSVMIADPQETVNKYAGTGTPVFSKGNQLPKEVIVTEKPIGQYYDKEKKEYPETDKAIIVYSKTGTYVYPIKGSDTSA